MNQVGQTTWKGETCALCGCKLPLAIMCHNAYPVSEGYCCVVCNYTRVIPARMEALE